jgi:hypothetical protein
MVLVLV